MAMETSTWWGVESITDLPLRLLADDQLLGHQLLQVRGLLVNLTPGDFTLGKKGYFPNEIAIRVYIHVYPILSYHRLIQKILAQDQNGMFVFRAEPIWKIKRTNLWNEMMLQEFIVCTIVMGQNLRSPKKPYILVLGKIPLWRRLV